LSQPPLTLTGNYSPFASKGAAPAN